MPRIRRCRLPFLLGLGLVLLDPFLCCRADEPDTDPAVLDAPVEVRFDGDGVAHIYAATEDDLYWAQGFVTAHHRLFEMDMLRRRAHGTRAEILGADYLDSDLQSRALWLREFGVLTAQALAVDDPPMHDAVVAYAGGVNQFIADAGAGVHGLALSPQFAALGYEPDPWTAADCLAIEKLLTAGLSMRPDQDIILGLTKVLLGDELFADLYRYAPLDPEYIVPEFYDGMAPYSAPGLSPPAAAGSDHALRAALSAHDPGALARAAERVTTWSLTGGGSNSFAVDGAHAEGGHALLASDSHQGIAHPAVYYLVHLSTAEAGGDMDVIGANFPGVPFVQFGTNGHVAWGPTTSLLDVADAYLETYTASGDEVVFRGQDVPVKIKTEVVRVRAQGGTVADAEELQHEFHWVPHHGPVMPWEALGLPVPLDISIRWTGYQPRSLSRSFHDMNTARGWDDFTAAMTHYFTGGMHFAYADADGRIGYTCRTEVPVREVVDPATPPATLLPGEGGHEWLQPVGATEPLALQVLPDAWIPHVVDPPRGFITTANNDPAGVTDDNDPYDDPAYLSALYDIGTRAWEPREELEGILAQGLVTLDDMQRIQLDTTSRPAVRMLPTIADAAARRPDLVDQRMQQALDLLGHWDHSCETDLVPPTLFHAWLSVFAREMLSDEVGVMSDMLFGEMSHELGIVVVKFIQHWFDATADIIDELDAGTVAFPSASGANFFDDRGTSDVVETRDELILASLDLTLDELAAVLEPLGADPEDMTTWTWGLVHNIQLVDLADTELPEASSGRLPKPGGLYTVDVADFTWMRDYALPERFDVANAPSNRFLWELAPGDVSGRWIIPGGQDEDPASPYHNDQLDEYVSGQYRDVHHARTDVEAATTETWTFDAGFPADGGWTSTTP